MSIGVHCTSCTSEFHVTSEFSGKLIRCPSCKEPVRVPDTPSASTAPATTAPQPETRSPQTRPAVSRRQETQRQASSSKEMNAASIKREPPRKPTPSSPAKSGPAQARSAKPKSAGRDRSFESRSRTAVETPSRKSSQSTVGRRPRGTKSQQNFPVGLAIGLGVGIAGLLIAVAAVVINDDDESLVAASDNVASQQDDFFANDYGLNGNTTNPATNLTPLTQPNHDASSFSAAEGDRPATSVASNYNATPSSTNFSATPDTSGLPSSNGNIDGSNQPSMGEGSVDRSTSDAALASERPPILRSWSDVNALVGPSIVRVDVKLSGGGGQGSGYVVDAKQGIIVTNYHVIEGALDAQVSFENGDRIDVDGFLFLDSKRDIAILKFDPLKSSQSNLRSLPLAIAHPLKGEEVAAFGAPIGLDFSMTQNIVSAIRPAEDMAKMLGLKDTKGTWIQHGVSISSGNSGGPLVNKRGEVVGMNTMGLTIGQNLNFAISGLDVTEGLSNQLPKMLAVKPSSAPVRHRSGGSAPDGSFDDPYERPEIEIVDVVGEERGEELLAKMKTLTILSISFSDDPNGTVTGAVRSEARKTIDRCKIRLTSSRSADYVLLMVMQLERSGTKNTLRMTSQILTKDDDAREILKIWELTEDVGTISLQSIQRAYLPPVLKKDIQKYFSKVRSELIDARRNYQPEDEKNK